MGTREFWVRTGVAAAFALLLIWQCSGCVHAHAHVAAPSTSAVSANVGAAASANRNAQRYNDIATGIAGRIDAKAGVIQKFWPQ